MMLPVDTLAVAQPDRHIIEGTPRAFTTQCNITPIYLCQLSISVLSNPLIINMCSPTERDPHKSLTRQATNNRINIDLNLNHCRVRRLSLKQIVHQFASYSSEAFFTFAILKRDSDSSLSLGSLEGMQHPGGVGGSSGSFVHSGMFFGPGIQGKGKRLKCVSLVPLTKSMRAINSAMMFIY